MILNNMPSPEDFYQHYWNKKPFMVRGYLGATAFEQTISPELLAGLALEPEIKSRVVKHAPLENTWHCQHGAFDEDFFAALPETHWSLLVQNVEQYHRETADLLKYFNFAPLWLLDDIMVSYSVQNGSAGPHKDSYNVFLVQGMGKRTWKIGTEKMPNATLADNAELEILQGDFAHQEITVQMGDVIYIPPHFAHSGITQHPALTFSIGFLGPKTSDLLVGFSLFLEDKTTALNGRFNADNATGKDAGATIHTSTANYIQKTMKNALESDLFTEWLAEYLATSGHEKLYEDDIPPSPTEIIKQLKAGRVAKRQMHQKIVITETTNNEVIIATGTENIVIAAPQRAVVSWLNEYKVIDIGMITSVALEKTVIALIEHNVLMLGEAS